MSETTKKAIEFFWFVVLLVLMIDSVFMVIGGLVSNTGTISETAAWLALGLAAAANMNHLTRAGR